MSDFTVLDDAIKEALDKYKDLPIAQHLKDVTLRVIVEKDQAYAWKAGDPAALVFPQQPSKLIQGIYYIEHDDRARLLRLAPLLNDGKIYIATPDPKVGVVFKHNGQTLERPVQATVPLGEKEYARKLRGSKGVFWVKLSVTVARSSTPPPDKFPLRYYEEVFKPDEFMRLAEQRGGFPWKREFYVISGPGMGNTKLEPGGFYEDPLDFTFHAHNEYNALVSRKGAGRDFYFNVPLIDIQQFQQAWVYRQVARNTAGMALLVQLMVEIAISFVPIVGPLYNLLQTGMNVYQASQHWGKMKGWEKALVGLDVLLTSLTGFGKALRAGKGLKGYNEGVKALKEAGLPHSEARTLMLGAGVFQDIPATRKVVEALATKLENGGSLTAKELLQVENIASEMLKRLPKAERALQTARFAMGDITTARQFFKGLDISEEIFTSMKNLSPEVLVQVQTLVKEERLTLALRIAGWGKDTALASGVNTLVGKVRPTHLTEIAAALGEETLRKLGQGELHIADNLAKLVSKQSGANKAYKTLMHGTKEVPGLNARMIAARQAAGTLSPDLAGVQSKLKVFLTDEQLFGVQRLGEKTQEMLKGAADSQIREIATIAAHSADAAKSIDKVVNTFAGRAKGGVLPGVIERMGGGLLEAIEKQGIHLSDDLIKAAAASRGGAKGATEILLKGFKGTKQLKAAEGLLDPLVRSIGTEARLIEVLGRISHPTNRAEVFSRWAVNNPQVFPGIDEVIKHRPRDAQLRIRNIYRDFKDQGARAIFEEIGWIAKAGPPKNLDLLLADLGGGFEKAMGASLVLDFAASGKVLPSSIKAFELPRQLADGRIRKYDIVVGSVSYEVKYWIGYGGKKLEYAVDEFQRDILIHASTGFKDLRWIISKDMKVYHQPIAELMYDALHKYKQRIIAAGHKFETVEQAFIAAADPKTGWLIAFH